jgi:AcrR family transcriptional regulator
MKYKGGATPKSIRTSELILDVAESELMFTGLDHVTFTTIARAAGLTTGAIYSRFENSSEMLVALWELRFRPALEAFLALYEAAVLNPDDKSLVDDLVNWMLEPPTELVLAVEALAIANRVDELEEVVAPFVAAVAKAPAPLSGMRFATLSILLGTIVYFPFSNGRKFARAVAETVVRLGRVTSVRDFGPRQHATVPTIENDETEVDPLIRSLLVATRSVIARSGFEHATVSRIARKWGHNPSTIYQHLENKSELLAETIRHALSHSLIARHDSEDMNDLVLVIGQTITNHLSPSRREYLRFRLEAHVAGLHHSDIGAVLLDEYAKYQERFAASSQGPRGIQLTASECSNAAYLGRAILMPFVPGCADFDFRPFGESFATISAEAAIATR